MPHRCRSHDTTYTDDGTGFDYSADLAATCVELCEECTEECAQHGEEHRQTYPWFRRSL